MKEGKIQGLYGTMFYVKDMNATVNFYKNIVGLKDSHESPEWSEFKMGEHRLCFHHTDDAELVKKGGMVIAQVKNLEAIVAGLKEKGVKMFSEIKEVHPGAYAADFIDADGHIMSLYEQK